MTATHSSIPQELLPASPVEVRLPERARATGPRPFFFGAARRSGTTWLSSMLNAHMQVECRNEGWLFNDLLDARGESASFPAWFDERKFRVWAARREAQGTWLRHTTIDDAAASLRRAMWFSIVREGIEREAWKRWPNLRLVGDKTTTHFCTQAEQVHRIFPDGCFLHMIRDGRDVAVSDAFLLFREFNDRDLPDDLRREAVAARNYHVLGVGRPVPLMGPATLRVIVGDWVRSVTGGLRARELFGPSYVEVKYERLTADPAGEFGALLEALGVDARPELVKQIVDANTFETLSGGRRPGEENRAAEFRKGVQGDWRNHFTNEMKQGFKALAGSLLVELGYEQDMSW
ncbi:MAG TPA: sulfotransferase [Phycisphaerales bacterium]|jgi:hypothetical protein|nr:sulfotransferase [Phycisphaerales bacterium]